MAATNQRAAQAFHPSITCGHVVEEPPEPPAARPGPARYTASWLSVTVATFDHDETLSGTAFAADTWIS